MSQAIEKQIQAAIDLLNDKKKAVLGIVKAFAEEEPVCGHWKDQNFVKEMDRRYNEYKSGKTKLLSLDEVEKRARAAVENIDAKKAGKLKLRLLKELLVEI